MDNIKIIKTENNASLETIFIFSRKYFARIPLQLNNF